MDQSPVDAVEHVLTAAHRGQRVLGSFAVARNASQEPLGETWAVLCAAMALVAGRPH